MQLKKGLSVFAFAALVVQPILAINVSAASTIDGQVFLDNNANGTLDGVTADNAVADSGVEDVLVTVFDAENTPQGSATTGSDGTYVVDADGEAPYRVEFTNIPEGLTPSGVGSTNGSTIQFVEGDSSANLGLTDPANYCQANAHIATSCFLQGDLEGDALVTFPYAFASDLNGFQGQENPGLNTPGNKPEDWVSRSDENMPTPIGFNDSIGTVYGLAYDQGSESLYTSSFVRRKSKLGGLSGESTGAIYKTSNVFDGASSAVYTDLNTVFGADTAGVNPHPAATTDFNDDGATSEVVSKAGLGDLELSADGSTLYAVNLADRSLYEIPTSGDLDATTINVTAIPTDIDGCDPDDVRPFAVGVNNDKVYVGGVCSAESSQDAGDIATYVWEYDGSNFTTVLSSDLTTYRGGETYQAWNPWKTVSDAEIVTQMPQPILSDIEFDGDDLILGFRDRYGDITPGAGLRPDQDPWPRGNGDILKAQSNGDGTWSINNEFYPTENPGDGTADEATSGALALLPSSGDVVTTAYDAVNQDQDGTERTDNFNTGGVQLYSNSTGEQTGAYDVYLAAYQDTLGKTNGLGDLEILCEAAPIEIGNYVWVDGNSNGIQDAGEEVLAGVVVELYQDGVLLGTATTDENGNYIFSSSRDGVSTASSVYNLDLNLNTDYEVRIAADQEALTGYEATISNNDSSDNGDSRDSDGLVGDGFYSANVNTGSERGADHTVDFGFVPAAIGGTGGLGSVGTLLFNDNNSNGFFDEGDDRLPGIELELFADTDNDCSIDAGSTAIATLTTDENGEYLFDELALDANYIVRVNGVDYSANTTGIADLDNNSQTAEGYCVAVTTENPDIVYADFGFNIPTGAGADTETQETATGEGLIRTGGFAQVASSLLKFSLLPFAGIIAWSTANKKKKQQ